mmetsp:Transcript_7804/g.12852  ORF Transcript_7804/g.12852 Transcript_7804/m.12852 type:complete len:961 (+) Transcript_7804:106-2988(+)
MYIIDTRNNRQPPTKKKKKMNGTSSKIKSNKSSITTNKSRHRHHLFKLCCLSSTLLTSNAQSAVDTTNNQLFTPQNRTIVTIQAMGARSAVSADFDGDGRNDLVSASSNDNAVSWYRNLGVDERSGQVVFSIKNKISWDSKGSRIVTVGDVDNDGDVDVVGASYYDSSLRWFENDGTGVFTEHLISSGVNEGQGVILADLDNDGDPDIASASSGDNTIAVFKNINRGIFCEIKEVVDDNAIGARTVVAADLNGDGWLDLASASKDDDSVSWYPNDGAGHFPEKIVISQGEQSTGAYSLVAVDIDQDGDEDLVVASNGNDHVSIWRNDGEGNFEKTLVYDKADFVLSVTAFDFDRDGDIDIASASFFDGRIIWYENVDGKGYEWRNHTIYDSNPNAGGHYVSYGDMDGDGDQDLIAVTNAENTVAVYWAATECDGNNTGAECCSTGSQWNGTACEFCAVGSYGIGNGLDAKCVACPSSVDDQCTIPGLNVLPPTCGLVTGCVNVDASIAACSCIANSVRDPETDICEPCPEGQIRPDTEEPRNVGTLGNYSVWQDYQGTCEVAPRGGAEAQLKIIIPVVVIVALLIIGLIYIVYRQRNVIKYNTRDVKHAPQDGTIVIVFTDIEGSTALWDRSKVTMTKALDVHHNVIRKVIERHNGYEVKTIGDSFMVALGCADSAVKLANDIQKDLLDAEWPTELANLPGGCSEFVNIRGEKVAKRVYNGLRVRIGIHLGKHSDLEEGGGQVQTKYDKVAKGYDYYGPAVNAASRIEALAFGGQTLLSTEVYSQLSDTVKDESLLHVVGGLKLKGIENEVYIYQCLPKELKGRTFKGVFRRRDSEGGSIGGPDDLEAMVTRGASILIGSSFIESEDLTGDVMAMTPIQLQSVVSRLRKKISMLESETNGNQGRRLSGLSSSSDLGDYPSQNGDGRVSPLKKEEGDFIDEVVGGMPVAEELLQPQLTELS